MNIYTLKPDSVPEGLRNLVLSLQKILGEKAYDFLLIGATARDLIIDSHFGLGAGRSTLDIDFALYVPEWGSYDEIMNTLLSSQDFNRTNTDPVHRIIYQGGIEVDIVPFGKIQNPDGEYTWPPPALGSMNVAGFMEINEQCITIATKDNSLSFKVASLPGIAMMKIFAWKDRKHKNNKDGMDIGFIINHYVDLKVDELYEQHDDIVAAEDFKLINASARILGRDIRELIQENEIALQRTCDILREELSDEENSLLARTMAHGGLSYITTYDALTNLLQGIEDK